MYGTYFRSLHLSGCYRKTESTIKWEECIDRLLGDSGWREEFYKKDPQMSLFDLFPETGQSDGERMIKDANPDHIRIISFPD